MADNTNLMLRDFANNPEFVEELLPAAKRTALLYHLSYLCLAPFPKLERIIRERAVETQLLFGSSEVILFKCVTTSGNLISSLLPLLKLAVENNKTMLASKSMQKANAWIDEIVQGVKDVIARYDKQNMNVASCTSDVIQEKSETEKIKAQTSDEMKSHEKALKDFDKRRDLILKEIEKTEKKIKDKNGELQSHVSHVCRKSQGLGIMASVVPFIGPLIKSIYETASEPGAVAKTHALTSELSQLSSEKSDLRHKEWNIHVKMTDLQLRLATLKIQDGTIPDPVHLGEVKQNLTRIQQILIQLQKFWETVRELLESLKKETLAGEDTIDERMSDSIKDFFIASIDKAEKFWEDFGKSCLKAKDIFSSETKDAYKFLEGTPSPGSKEWEQEYKSVMEKLKEISPQPICN